MVLLTPNAWVFRHDDRKQRLPHSTTVNNEGATSDNPARPFPDLTFEAELQVNPLVAQHYAATMNAEAAAELSVLWQQRADLEKMYDLLRQIIHHSPEARQTMNHVAPGFRALVVNALWTNLLVGLACFTQRDGRGPQPSPKISLRTFLDRHTGALPPQVKEELDISCTALHRALRPVMDMRNHRIAHWNKESYCSKRPLDIHAIDIDGAFHFLDECFRAIAKGFGVGHFHAPPNSWILSDVL